MTWKPTDEMVKTHTDAFWATQRDNLTEIALFSALIAVQPLIAAEAVQKFLAEDYSTTVAALIERAQAEARAKALEEAAKVADADQIRECPYGNDKKGDPTWNHTDKDLCPVCHKNGEDSLGFCVATSKYRIANAIRSLIPKPVEAA